MNIGFLPKIAPRNDDDQHQADIDRQLMRMEAQIGGQLFGPVPAGHERQFFCLDAHTWIWHEEWTDKHGKRQVVTTRYEVRPSGVIKSQDGQSSYQRLSMQEAQHLYRAVELYNYRVSTQYQQMLQTT